MGSTRLVFIRHGESRSNAEGWMSGNATCGGLSELGRTQAAALRDRLAGDADLKPDAIVSSTMARAVETAELVASPTGLEVTQIAELSERQPGECEGMTHADYRERYGRRPYEEWEAPLSPGGESHLDFFGRATTAVTDLATDYEGQTVWIVCHGGIIVAAATFLMRGSIEDGVLHWANPVNSSVSEWQRNHWGRPTEYWTLRRYNDHAHLLD